jgi:cytochrome c biogenesis protein CcdA
MVGFYPFYSHEPGIMWQDIIKTLLNVSIGAFTVFMQVFQQLQTIVAIIAGIVTIVYLCFQIKKIRLDIKLKQNQFSKDEHKIPGSFRRK